MIKKPTLALIAFGAGLFLSSAAQAADLPTSNPSTTNSASTVAPTTMLPTSPDAVTTDATTTDAATKDKTVSDSVGKTSSTDPKGMTTKPDASGTASQ